MERMSGAILTGFLLTMAAMPFFIRYMRRKSLGQEVRAEGPREHQSKQGTPTMGGLVVLLAFLVCSLWQERMTSGVMIFLALTVAAGLLGAADDALQMLYRRSLGLRAREKMFIQAGLGIILSLYILYFKDDPCNVWLPGGGVELPRWAMVLLVLLVFTGFSNAANLTDGLDGLASGLGIIALAACALVCLKAGRGDLALGAFSLAGCHLGFLWFNAHPAEIFMGDTGSLSLGAALATLSVLTGTEVLLLVIGGVFVVETLSVMIQVTWFKLSKKIWKLEEGRRIFRMSPLHHHLELTGWPEGRVTVRFWIAGALLGLAGLYLYIC